MAEDSDSKVTAKYYSADPGRSFLAKLVARRLNFIYYSKISIKSNKPSSKPSKPLFRPIKPIKPASDAKFQASKLRLSGLAWLLNSKSVPFAFYVSEPSSRHRHYLDTST